VRAWVGRLPSDEPPFDVVLANLIAGVLVPLAAALHDELRPGGVLVASGIFIDRETEVVTAFEAAGLRIEARTAEGEWIALESRRPA
jgi:ribosomal protein L11 methyltransferase